MYDAQKEVAHLSTKMSNPTIADLAKPTLVLRYLKGTPKLGPTNYYIRKKEVLFSPVLLIAHIYTRLRIRANSGSVKFFKI